MGIIILLLFIYYFEKKIKHNDSKTILWLHLILFLYFLFSLFLNYYLEHFCGWRYGVAGVDLTAHFNGAEALSKGHSINELYKIAHRYEISISGFPYILYAYILRIVSFTPVIISYKFSLQFMYVIQLILAVLSVDNICKIFPNSKNRYNYVLLFTVATCVCITQQASILMRDIWAFYILTCFYSLDYKTKRTIIRALFLMLLAFIFRNYTILITLPFFIWKLSSNIKLGVISSLMILLMFIFGQSIISGLAVTYGIKWEFGFNFNFIAIIRYILFPNFITQTHNVQHPSLSQYSSFGANTEWIYYILSIWNLYVYPLVAYGIYKVFKEKDKIEEGIIWFSQIINIGFIYNVFYNSVSEPRHKLLILFGLLFFFNEAILKIKKINLVLYVLLISLIVLLSFAVIN